MSWSLAHLASLPELHRLKRATCSITSIILHRTQCVRNDALQLSTIRVKYSLRTAYKLLLCSHSSLIPVTFLRSRNRFRKRRRKRTLLSDLRTFEVEPNRHWYEKRGDTAKQSRSPLDTHTFEHLTREKRECSSTKTTQECIRCDSGCGKLVVRLAGVVCEHVELTIKYASTR